MLNYTEIRNHQSLL